MQFCVRKLGFAGAHIAERAFPQQSLVKNAESLDFWFIQPVRHRASRTPVFLPRRVMTRPRVRYFAYGSNMLTARLRERVPSAAAIGIGKLVAHALRWDKRSWQGGSGKCDAEATSRNDDVVWGVLFELDPERILGRHDRCRLWRADRPIPAARLCRDGVEAIPVFPATQEAARGALRLPATACTTR